MVKSRHLVEFCKLALTYSQNNRTWNLVTFVSVKKLVITILAVLYLGLTTGMAVNIHYCMGKLASVQVNTVEGKACKCSAKAKKPMPCCKYEYKVIKLSDSHKQAFIENSFQPFTALYEQNNFFPSLVDRSNYTSYEGTYPNAPPLLNFQPLYVQYCVFRI